MRCRICPSCPADADRAEGTDRISALSTPLPPARRPSASSPTAPRPWMRGRICLSCPADAETPKAPTGFRRCPPLFTGAPRRSPSVGIQSAPFLQCRSDRRSSEPFAQTRRTLPVRRQSASSPGFLNRSFFPAEETRSASCGQRASPAWKQHRGESAQFFRNPPPCRLSRMISAFFRMRSSPGASFAASCAAFSASAGRPV